MNWLALPRVLYGLVFGGLAPWEVDTKARLVCHAFASVLPVWHTVDLDALNPGRTSLDLEVSQVRRIHAHYNQPYDILASLRQCSNLRALHVILRLDKLPALAESLAADVKERGFDLDLELEIVDTGMGGRHIRLFEALPDSVVSLTFRFFYQESLLAAFARSWSRLLAVDISGHKIGSVGLSFLTASGPALKQLHCNKCGLEDKHTTVLCLFSSLTDLDIGENAIADVRFTKFMPSLRRLRLARTLVQDLQPLTANHALEELDLRGCRLPVPLWLPKECRVLKE